MIHILYRLTSKGGITVPFLAICFDCWAFSP